MKENAGDISIFSIFSSSCASFLFFSISFTFPRLFPRLFLFFFFLIVGVKGVSNVVLDNTLGCQEYYSTMLPVMCNAN